MELQETVNSFCPSWPPSRRVCTTLIWVVALGQENFCGSQQYKFPEEKSNTLLEQILELLEWGREQLVLAGITPHLREYSLQLN